jgi:hypothetical protein
MVLFDLNVFNGIDAFDKRGIKRPDLDAAKFEAVVGARDVIANLVRYGKPVCRSHRIEINDEAGKLLHTVRFSDVIDLRP